jgi:hypothetical protein
MYGRHSVLEKEVEDFPPPPYEAGAQPRRAVTAVMILNFLLAAVSLLCGLQFMAAGAFFAGLGGAASILHKGFANFGDVSTILVVYAGSQLALGVIAALAGIGVLARRQWGRFLTLATGVLVLALAVIHVVMLHPFTIVWGGLLAGYTVTVFILLLNRDNAGTFS